MRRVTKASITIFLLLVLAVSALSSNYDNISSFIFKSNTISPGSVNDAVINPSGYNLDGDEVVWENNWGKLEVYPHTSNDIVTQTQYANFTWYQPDNNIDIAFRFDQQISNANIWMWQNISHDVIVVDYGWVYEKYVINNISDFSLLTEIPEYLHFGDIPSEHYAYGIGMNENKIMSLFIGFDSFFWLNTEHTSASFNYTYWGMTGEHIEQQYWYDWYSLKDKFSYEQLNNKHYYYAKNLPVKQDTEYKIKWQYNIPKNSNGKWELLVKLSSDTIQYALNNDRYIMIDPWWDSNWLYSKKIVLSSAQVQATQTNFPVLIDITDTDLRDHAQSHGQDIAFLNETNETKLNHEIEFYDTVTGHLVAWVNVTSLSSVADTVIYMYYGNAGASDQQNMYGTWDGNYVAVYHMNNLSTTVVDSTNHQNGTIQADTADLPERTTGKIGYSIGFTKNNLNGQRINITGLTSTTQTYTVSFWSKSNSTNVSQMIFDFQTGRFLMQIVDSSNKIDFADAATTFGPSMEINSWYYYTATAGSGVSRIFINSSQYNTTKAWTPVNLGGIAQIGGRYNSLGSGAYWYSLSGSLDELRLSNIVRSNATIETEFNTMNNATNGSFFTLGWEESEAPTGAQAPYINMTSANIANNSWEVDPNIKTVSVWIQDNDSLFNWTIFTTAGDQSGENSVQNKTATAYVNLSYCTTYYWWVNTSNDTDDDIQRVLFVFHTKNSTAPTFSFENPTNNSYGVVIRPGYNLTIEQAEGQTFNYSWYCSCGSSNSATGNTNGSKTLDFSGNFPLNYCTQYYVQINATTVCGTYTNATYYFTTINATPTTHLNPNPANNSYGNYLDFTWNITIEQPEGQPFDWTIVCSNGQNNNGFDESNGSKTLALTNLIACNHQYFIWVNSTPTGCNQWLNDTYSFYTMNWTEPYFMYENPANNSLDIDLIVTWNVTIEQAEGEWFWYCLNSSHGEQSCGSGINGSYALPIAGLDYCTKYYVDVTAWTNCSLYRQVFDFTTISMAACTYSFENPPNGTEDVAITFLWNVTIISPDSESFNVTIQSNSGDSDSWNDVTDGSFGLNFVGLSYSTNYTVWVNTTNNCSNTSSEFYYFVTMASPGGADNPPTQSNPSVLNGSTCVLPNASICITISDIDGSTMNITWWSNSSGSWVMYGSNSSVGNGTYCQNNSNFTDINTTYYWSVNLSDGVNWSNITYYFTTIRCPNLTLIYPANESTGIGLQPTIQIFAYDYCGLGLTINWYQNTSGTYDWNQTNSTVTANTSVYFKYYNASSYSTVYSYWITINNSYCNISYYFHFTTESAPAPGGAGYITWTLDYPENGTSICPCCFNINFTITSSNGSLMNITIFSNYSGNWEVIDNNLVNLSNGTYGVVTCDFNLLNTVYYWNATIADGSSTNVTELYHLTTYSNMSQCFPKTVVSYAWAIVPAMFGLLALVLIFVRKYKVGGI